MPNGLPRLPIGIALCAAAAGAALPAPAAAQNHYVCVYNFTPQAMALDFKFAWDYRAGPQNWVAAGEVPAWTGVQVEVATTVPKLVVFLVRVQPSEPPLFTQGFRTQNSIVAGTTFDCDQSNSATVTNWQRAGANISAAAFVKGIPNSKVRNLPFSYTTIRLPTPTTN